MQGIRRNRERGGGDARVWFGWGAIPPLFRPLLRPGVAKEGRGVMVAPTGGAVEGGEGRGMRHHTRRRHTKGPHISCLPIRGGDHVLGGSAVAIL